MRPVFATIHLGHLAHNYQLLQQKAGDSKVIAVVKADAYGHGLKPVAKTLFDEGCRFFAVTDAEEGALLRTILNEHAHGTCHILLLSGLCDKNDAIAAQQYHLTPVISAQNQLQYLLEIHFKGDVWLKVDTGMHRIGTTDLHEMIAQIHNSPINLSGIMSHLACADTPQHPSNQAQLAAFKVIQESTHAPAYSLLNSAGLTSMPEACFDFVRPGIALYGAEPIPDQPLGLKPVMQLKSKIIQVCPIQAGESASYGATWTAPKFTHIAVAALGYADGLPRLLSNQGKAAHHSGVLPIVGRVCMDHCLLEVDNKQVRVGDEVTFFGYNQAPLANDVASQCQTIAYEIFTGISTRVTRHYIKDGL